MVSEHGHPERCLDLGVSPATQELDDDGLVLRLDDKLEVTVSTGLLAKQSVDAPPTVNSERHTVSVQRVDPALGVVDAQDRAEAVKLLISGGP